MAIVFGEPDAESFQTRLVDSSRRVISAVNLFEAALVAERRGGLELRDRLDRLISRLQPEVIPFDERHLGWARDAYRRFGKGRHPAALNLGDCIAYATARVAALPLLFKGSDFEQTDIARVD